MMRNKKRFIAGAILLLLLASTACSGKTSNQTNHVKLQQNASTAQPINTEDAIIPMVTQNGRNYIPIKKLAYVLQYNSEWDAATQTFRIGDTDAAYEITINSNKAVKDGANIITSGAPVVLNGTAYIPVSALADLFNDDMSYHVTGSMLIIHPAASNANGSEEDFADDPADPFKGEAKTAFHPLDDSPNMVITAAVLRNINVNALIRTAKRYLEVPYRFGTVNYAQSGKFDCSTFTQYVFHKYGINLPRTARAQSMLGQWGSRKSLRKGDLLFFSVPGRFKNNNIVGHVGIYIGNMQMIHSCPVPKNGVQISNINTAYWKSVFLKDKRFVY